MTMLGVTDFNRKWWILIAMGGGAGLIMLDETVVGVALPTMRRDLGMSAVTSHWVVSVYLLVFAVTAAAGGKLGDIVGFRNLVLTSLGVFGLGSLASGFADGGGFLIAARAFQGLGAAVIFSATIAMVTLVFPRKERGMAIGFLAAIGTIFLAVGPLVGGFLTEIVSWRWIFWINVPIVLLIALMVAAAWVEPPRKSVRPSIDYGGLAMLVASLGMLVFAIMQGPTWGWTHGIIVLFLSAGIVTLALFVLVESRRDEPLIDVDLFRIPSFSACAFVLFVGQYSKMAIVVFGALYLQDALGMSPMRAGLALLVSVAAFPFLSAPVGRIADKHGARRPVLVGMPLATLAIIWAGIATAWASYALLLPGLVAWGIGMSFCYSPTLRAMSNAVPSDKQGQSGGIAVTCRMLGGTIGMAACSTLLVVSGNFQILFLVTGGLLAAASLLGWFALERPDPDPTLSAR